jgi:hypothetical protein
LRQKNMLFMTYFSDDVTHCLNEVHRTTALHDCLKTPNGTRLPRFMRTTTSTGLQRHARSPNAHSWVRVSASIKEPRPRKLVSRLASLIAQEGEGTSVTSSIMQQYIWWYYTLTLYYLTCTFPSEGRTTWVRCHCNKRYYYCTILLVPSGTYNKFDLSTWRVSLISRDKHTASLVWLDRRKSSSTWHRDKARTCAS